MTDSVSIKARDCCLKEKKRLVETLDRCDMQSNSVKKRHRCYQSAARESGRRSRQCIIA
ncbi:MAG: hypothetical protein LJE66_06150 [Desulfobacterales bacterium]|nr:hypothetical protein [Desulfobacterales bacterium]